MFDYILDNQGLNLKTNVWSAQSKEKYYQKEIDSFGLLSKRPRHYVSRPTQPMLVSFF